MPSPIQTDSQSSLVRGAGCAVFGQLADSVVIDMGVAPLFTCNGCWLQLIDFK